jgi:hypothetical protein
MSIPKDSPATVKQAVRRPDADQKGQAVKEELVSLKSMRDVNNLYFHEVLYAQKV